MLPKNQSHDLRNFCAIYEVKNADNTRTLRIWFDDKLYEVYATNVQPLSEDDFDVFVTNTHCSLPTW